MIFALGGQSTQTSRSQVSFCTLTRMCISLLARGTASVPHSFSLDGSLSKRSLQSRSSPMNAYLKSSDGYLEAKRGVPVLVFPSAGLHL
ncbi:hypothetical protein Golob_005852 [Gossypium lobatum]|uniref:Uncharacterized protein n=1 Tax=Gossypium lobatum TaxID=34289 RepID=A0A7J8MUH1_9ROSI|nr:hypothetical protein [Gossypium lobatum]